MTSLQETLKNYFNTRLGTNHDYNSHEILDDGDLLYGKYRLSFKRKELGYCLSSHPKLAKVRLALISSNPKLLDSESFYSALKTLDTSKQQEAWHDSVYVNPAFSLASKLQCRTNLSKGLFYAMGRIHTGLKLPQVRKSEKLLLEELLTSPKAKSAIRELPSAPKQLMEELREAFVEEDFDLKYMA